MSACFDVHVQSCAQLEALCHLPVTVGRYYIDAAALQGDGLQRALEVARDTPLYAALPYMTREEEHTPDIEDLRRIAGMREIRGVLVRNLEQLGFLVSNAYAGEMIADYGLYVWNHDAFLLLKEAARGLSGFCLPHEISAAQGGALLQQTQGGTEVSRCVYGYVPMMVSAGCVRLSDPEMRCSGKRGEWFSCEQALFDRTGRRMRVTCQCRYCYNVIWNAYPLSLHAYPEDPYLPAARVRQRIDFSTESPREAADILAFFAGLGEAAKAGPPYADYTTGRYRKGVE